MIADLLNTEITDLATLESLPVGGACDAVYLTPQGRMITDMRVFRRESDVIVSVPAVLTAALAGRLDSLI